MELPDSIVADVIEHMNADHADSLLDYAHVFGAVDRADSVTMTGLSSTTMTLQAVHGASAQMLEIPLVAEIKRPEQIRGVLVAMARQARKAMQKDNGK